ncbi:MAG TPA: 16S rRNA (uracil(1498)-N(3))-methyltransferase [Vicinamibacterales bacterium]|nr:16S rRNA (uracil(1498)-N(3))-methyltransferase [Vicinamibacterales bacterium]
MRPRFHAPDVHASAARVELPEDEAEHLVRVLRLGVGDEVDVFDGRGGLWRAEVVEAGKHAAAIRPVSPLAAARELGTPVTLVMSLLKGDKMDDVVRDATMLGVTAIRPVVSERSETSLAALVRGNRLARWQRIAISSVKQCGRAVVPEILPAVPLDWYWTEPVSGSKMMCVEPSAALTEIAAVQTVPKPSAAQVIVGPEGGWTVTEIATAHESGAILMTLGARTIRADAVPIVALTALLTTWREL